MKAVYEFFRELFDAKSWPPKWHCGYWSGFHGWLYILSDLSIATAYFLIPLIIINYLSKRKQKVKFTSIYILFATFILLCGTTHLLDAAMFWVPMYRLNALVRFITAIVSLATVYQLIKVLPEIFRQKSNIELENEIARRKQAELQLSGINKDLEAFVYVASHDLQEPLRKIKTFSQLLHENNFEKFDEASHEYSKKIIKSADRMQTLIKNVLTLSTIPENFEMSAVDVAAIIADIKEDLEIKILERKAQITVGEIPLVRGNKVHLTQLFFNLISNSIKFSKKDPVIEITAETKNSIVYIHVSDNGIGIDSGETTRIFEAFTRLNANSEYEGSGIGLTICRKIIDIHNGDIKVKSRPGEGTIFTIELQAA